MRKNVFMAILICIAVFLTACTAETNDADIDTDFKGAETSVQENQNDKEQYTINTKISDVINDPVFGDYGRLIFPVNNSYYSGDTSARTSPSELTIKQSCLSFETSIPTEITITNPSSGKYVMLHPQCALLL